MSVQLRPGMTLFILYQGHPLWHERLVLATVAGSTNQIIILTPDDDSYLEDLSADNTDIEDVKICRERNVLPRGVPAGEAYRFRQYPDGGQMRELVREAREMAGIEALRRGRENPSNGSSWIAIETVKSVTAGDLMELHADAITIGDKCINVYEMQGERFEVFGIFVEGEGVEEKRRSLRQATSGDARTLPVLRVNGVRQRDFKDAVDKMEELPFDDWKVAGPRTVGWCCRFLASRNGPFSHHEWWKSVTKLTAADPGVAEHEACMRALTDACCFDQLGVVNCAAFEHVMRKAQLWEHHYKEKLRIEAASSKDKPIIDVEEQPAFLGTTVSENSLMICPQLTEFVAKELQKGAEIEKQARKAREERALRRR